MARATATWSLPTTREGGAAFDPANELARSEIRISSDGGTSWSAPAVIPPADTQFIVDNLAIGDYLFELVFVDITGRRSAEAIEAATLIGAPSAASDFTVIIEE